MIRYTGRKMSKTRHPADCDVLVRFWSLDHHRAESVLWPVSDWPKLVYSAEGSIQVELSGRLFILPPNRAIWIAAGEVHPARTLGSARVRTLYFSPDVRVDRQMGMLEVRPLLRELIIESCQCGPLRVGETRSEAIVALLIGEIEVAAPIAAGVTLPSSKWLREWAASFMDYPLEFPPYACSRRTLERHMLKETGLTLGQWCQQARALVGLRALAAGATVIEAGIEAGFATPSGFIQSFRKQFGTTPGRILRDGLMQP